MVEGGVSMSNDNESEDFRKRLSFSLLLCRLSTVFIFGIWAYGTIIRPEIASIQLGKIYYIKGCLLYTSPSPRDKRQSRMPSSA